MGKLLRVTATVQLLLVVPAVLFLGAALVGMGKPPQYDLAEFAHRVVAWYVARSWTLPLLLIALPFAAGLTGVATLGRNWNGDQRCVGPQSLSTIPAPLATLLMASTTMMSIAILGVVGLHMLAN